MSQPYMRPAMTPDLTLLVCTRNRAMDLAEMLDSALTQDAPRCRFEILVVDNGSTDGTHAAVTARMPHARHPIRYVREPSPGKGAALRTGLGLIEAPLYAIVDDDLLLSPGYVDSLWQAFQQHPDVSCIGGRVAPRWQGEVPAWLDERHYGALALTTYGETPIKCSSARPLTILAGAFRTPAVQQVGGYREELAVGAGGIGGTEDTDLLERMYAAGMRALYWPSATIFHKVEPERLTKGYHRRWHRGHGRFYARMRSPDLEASRWRILDVPGHLLRRLVVDAGQWLFAILTGDGHRAFSHEIRLQFTLGFVGTRLGLLR